MTAAAAAVNGRGGVSGGGAASGAPGKQSKAQKVSGAQGGAMNASDRVMHVIASNRGATGTTSTRTSTSTSCTEHASFNATPGLPYLLFSKCLCHS